MRQNYSMSSRERNWRFFVNFRSDCNSPSNLKRILDSQTHNEPEIQPLPFFGAIMPGTSSTTPDNCTPSTIDRASD